MHVSHIESKLKVAFLRPLALDLVDGLSEAAHILTSDASYGDATIFRSVYRMLLDKSACIQARYYISNLHKKRYTYLFSQSIHLLRFQPSVSKHAYL